MISGWCYYCNGVGKVGGMDADRVCPQCGGNGQRRAGPDSGGSPVPLGPKQNMPGGSCVLAASPTVCQRHRKVVDSLMHG